TSRKWPIVWLSASLYALRYCVASVKYAATPAPGAVFSLSLKAELFWLTARYSSVLQKSDGTRPCQPWNRSAILVTLMCPPCVPFIGERDKRSAGNVGGAAIIRK